MPSPFLGSGLILFTATVNVMDEWHVQRKGPLKAIPVGEGENECLLPDFERTLMMTVISCCSGGVKEIIQSLTLIELPFAALQQINTSHSFSKW